VNLSDYQRAAMEQDRAAYVQYQARVDAMNAQQCMNVARGIGQLLSIPGLVDVLQHPVIDQIRNAPNYQVDPSLMRNMYPLGLRTRDEPEPAPKPSWWRRHSVTAKGLAGLVGTIALFWAKHAGLV